MCLLIVSPATTSFDKDDIADFYRHNPDGLGVMYATPDGLMVQKTLPKTADEAFSFYLECCAGRESVIHFRWKTHGEINTDNCHPYEVYGDGSEMPLYVAHNGVLHTGNAADPKMSDTWHYINDFIKPILNHSPSLIYEPAFISMIEEHIGTGNKFVFMNHEGRLAIINEDQFVKYKGALLSNTYAWTASKGGFNLRPTWGGHAAFGGFNYDDDYGWESNAAFVPANATSEEARIDDVVADFFDLLHDGQHHKAHLDLQFRQVENCVAKVGITTFELFLECVADSYIEDGDIIECVTNPDRMLEYLYDETDPEKKYDEDGHLRVGLL